MLCALALELRSWEWYETEDRGYRESVELKLLDFFFTAL
jgi:hypothetical protein